MKAQGSFEIVAGNLQGCFDPAVAIAASRWGATGLLNLEGASPDGARAAFDRFVAYGHGTLGVKVDAAIAEELRASWLDAVHVVVLSTTAEAEWPRLVASVRHESRRVLCECTSEEQARLAVTAGADGIVAKGNEAGGHVGDETTFVLVQRVMACGVPVWAAGGISPHTAAACRVAGCAGVVVDAALALTRESLLPPPLRAVIERTEGDDTACVGAALGDLFRLHRRHGAPLLEQLLARDEELAAAPLPDAVRVWRDELRLRMTAVDGAALWPLGQDASFAAPLAARHRNVAGVLNAVSAAVTGHVRTAQRLAILGPNAPLAAVLGVTYPILQGPMTRVSDTAGFADSVSSAGALPFLALALMRGAEVRRLLDETRARLGDRPWGVGILGFVPPDLRQEQLEAVQAMRPGFAIIAGGRPDQAVSLERIGIVTYLHVPSPALLRVFVEGGARRFVFEGRECGGHVGPRTSFVLWTAMIDALLDAVRSGVRGDELNVVFAGGVHDACSAAMVSALAAPLAAVGIRVGVIVGTAYLFTAEAVASNAIGPVFQREALECTRTVLFETAPGHAIRCADTPYYETFRQLRYRLASEGRGGDDLKQTLESINLGRLRVASKGIARETAADGSPRYVAVPASQQRVEGMYMLGQVAALRSEVLSMRDLHEQISVAGTARLAEVEAPSVPAAAAPPPADVAIVGMACILPGASDTRTFWSNVLHKVDAVTEVPPDRFDVDRYFDGDVKARDRIVSRWGGFMGDVPFDPVKFGIPPSALASIDAPQLLALEVVDQALKDAGLDESNLPSERTAVIFGASGGLGDLGMRYGVRAMLPSLVDGVSDEVLEQLPEWTEDSFAGLLLNVTAGRVANRFNFGGANYTVDAACASSLAAVQLGIVELARGTSDVAVVGGLDTVQTPFGYMCFSTARALSPHGRCKTFDQSADGIAISEGVVALVIKRLADAERDGDRIYAVVKAVAGSSDGRGKGLTAPRPEGQMRALRRAYAQAGFSPSTVGLIEAHGTGTVAGDSAEIASLDEVFREAGAAPESCAVGSVKSMIGHTKATAGVAGVLKAVLALHHRVLPPTLHVETPNQRLREAGTPFFVNADATPWAAGAAPRRAGVSSFGFGGTNFHAVLEEYTGAFLGERETGCDRWPAELFLWGAESPAALQESIALIRRAVAEPESPSLHSLAVAVCRTWSPAATGRLAVVATSIDDLVAKLATVDGVLSSGGDTHDDPRGVYLRFGRRPGAVAFLFPGQGSQAPGMLRDLAVQFGEMGSALQVFDSVLDGRLPKRLTTYIYPPSSFTVDEQGARARALTDTRVAQPALGAVEVGALKLLAACGVRPDMVAGHSYGEYVALHAAGAIGERTLAVLSERRGSAIADAVRDRPGQMVAAAADPTAIRAALGARDGVWLANFNAPRQTIIAGEEAAVDDAAAALVRSGIMTFRLPVACAFHTPLMHEARARLDDALEAAAFVRPQLPVYSNALAGPYPDDPAQMRTVLADHLESPVRFVEEIREMYDAGARIFVEVGPGTVLTKLARQIVPDAVTVALDESDTQGVVRFLHALARLAAQGVSVDPARLARQRVTEALDVQLRRVTSRATPAWVVNGAGARSLAVASKAGRAARLRGAGSDANREKTPAPTAPEPLPLPQSFSAAESSMHNRVAPEQDHSAAGAAVPSAGPDAVMVQFQGVMARFLETQAAIMAAYLGAPAGATATAQAPLPLQEVPAGLSTGGTHAALAPSPPPAAVPAARPVMLAASAPAPAPAPVAHVAHAAASSQPPTPQRSTDFATLLVQVAADRTGYAAEMLGLDLSIEADLGIDSIKRVEILSSVRGRCSDVEQERLQTVMDTLTRAKTLREMVQIMKTAAAAAQGADAVAGSPVTVASPSPVSLGQELARVVSERTGYSIEMLGFDLNIEADLGIDSIKRVEILSTFRQRRTAEDQALLQGLMDQLTRLKTLGEMSKTIEEALRAPMATLAAPVSHMVAPLSATTVSDSAARVLLSVAAAPAAIPTPSSRAEMGVTLVTDDGGGVARDVCTRLRASGERVVLLRQRPGAEVELADGECTADWTNAAPAARALDRIRRAGPVAALLHVAPLAASGTRLERMPLSSWQQRVHADLRQLHVLVQAVAPDLQTAGRARGAAILAATALGGDFGEAGRFDRPTHGGVLGYMRTVAIEYPDVRTRVVDVSPETSPGGVAERIVTELDVEGPLEIGYADRGRMTVVPRRAPLTRSAPIPIDRETVVLLTGGARGITAELALELARRFRPTLVLAGLSALSSEPESASTLGLEGNHLRTALARQLGHANIPARPVDVEAAYRRIVHQREIHETLDAIRAAGSAVEYHQVDVRSEASLTGFVESLYQRFGRLDVVVHGAGVIEDKLIEDKSVESFDRVVQTKADSALLLLQCLRHDTLRAFVLMSSVTAAFGNRGQADYGAANGVYNALAQYLAARSRGRVVAMNWGPWDKRGMASEGVRRQFLARGITPIDPALGVRAVLDELAAGLPSDAVVVVGDGPWAGEAPADRVMELHA